MLTIDSKINSLFDLYEAYGNDIYFGENVTQLQHAFQTAELARRNDASVEIILAAFFHDIGHLCVEATESSSMVGNIGIRDHEKVGADFLKAHGFSDTVCKLVAAHVPAKRYLAFKFPEYKKQLSDASLKTLAHQGGIMNAEEATQFESDPLHQQYIQMRLWDEAAKEVEIPVGNLNEMKMLTKKYLLQQQAVLQS